MPTSYEEIKRFLEGHKFNNTSELAKLADVSQGTIRRWYRKVGHTPFHGTGSSSVKPYERDKIKLPSVGDPAVWDNADWFEEYYTDRGYGIRSVGKIISRSAEIVLRRLSRYGIPTRTFEESQGSDNPCCSREWLEEHYIKKLMPLRQCAKLAGVNRYTIYGWLSKFDLPVRDMHEAISISSKGRKLPEHVKKLISKRVRERVDKTWWQKPS